MSNPSRIPDLPAEFLSSDDPLVGMFVPLGISAHADLVDAAGKFETVREAENRAASALETSEAPEAVAYRSAQESANETLEAIKAERDKEIEAIREKYKGSISEVTNALTEQKNATLKALQVDVMDGINVTELVVNYTAKLGALKILGTNLKDQCPELHAYVKSLPSRTTQARGGANSSVDRNWTPRLAFAEVVDPEGNNVTPEPTTLGAIAKIVGGTRQFHADQLRGAIGSPDNLSVDPANPSVYTVTNNGKTWTVKVAGRDKDADD